MKRLTRDLNDVILGGVCSGMSKYFGISDPTKLRLLFALGIILSPQSFVLLYLIFWLVIPG